MKECIPNKERGSVKSQVHNMKEKINAIRYLSKQLRYASIKFWVTTLIKDLLKNIEYFFVDVLLIKVIVDALIVGTNMQEIVQWVILAVCIRLIRIIVDSYYNNIINTLEPIKIEEYFIGIVMDKSNSVDMKCYDEMEYYNNYVMAVQDIDKKAMKMVNDMGTLLGTMVLIALTGTFVLVKDPILLFFVIAPVIGDAVLRVKISNKEYAKEEKISKIRRKQDYINKVNNESRYAEEVRLSSIARFFDKLFSENIEEAKKVTNFFFGGLLRLYLFSDSLYEPKNLLIILYLAYKAIIVRDISAGDFIAIQTALAGFSSNLGKITQRTTVFNEHILYSVRFKSFMEYKNSVVDGTQSLGAIYRIEFKNVSFRYGENLPYILDGINLEIKAGEQLALIGQNGQGKSTLIKLLMRFYDVSEGEILVNGNPIKQYKIDDLRHEVLFLSQQFHCFKISIISNILLRKRWDGDKKIRDYLYLFHLDEILEKFPNREYSVFGKDLYEDAIELSRGQQQKVAICRALNKEGSFLIMDEPSAALDPNAETELLNAMKGYVGKNISIIISHNLSLTKHATKIAVLDKGKIEEIGSHNELLQKDGIYKCMYLSQMKTALGKAEQVF